jgi:hypothetical protein
MFADVLIKPHFTGATFSFRLSVIVIIRYNPAQVLGHMLGQRVQRWRAKSTG